MTHTMSLPWPHKGLSPNARLHWAAVAKLKKAARADAANLAYWYGLQAPSEGKIEVRLTFCPPSRRRFDLDGLQSRCKAYLDGIADHLGVDDYNFVLRSDRGDVDPEKKGCVRVELVAA